MHSGTIQLDKCKSTDMFLKVTTIIVSLAICIQYIEGIDRMIIIVSDKSDINDDTLVSHDEDISAISVTGNARGSGSHKGSSKASLTTQLCCIYGNFLSITVQCTS